MNYNLENCPLTLNTTRICATDAMSTSIEVSRFGFNNMKPNAVILVNKDEIYDGISATSLVHHPINAPILFTDGNSLSKETLREIKRLSPKGYKGIHVILVGNISRNVSSELSNHGFKTQHIEGRNYYETACIISRIRKEFKNILIISGEDYSEGIVAGYWSAHHGDPILFVLKNEIPCCTLEAVKKMKDINIYIVGSKETVSKKVENYLCQLDNVKHLERIDGETPYDIAVNFAKYKDPKTGFGWGRNYREGHAFTFGAVNSPMKIVSGVLFAHMGKHTPALLVGKNKIPPIVGQYIKSVKPMPQKDMPKPPFMHGFILGDTKGVSYDVQISIEDMLSIDHEMMEGMNHEMMMGDHMMMNHMDHKAMMKDHMMMDDMNHEMMIGNHMMMNDTKHEAMMKDNMMMDDMNHEMMMGNHMMMHGMDHETMMKDHMKMDDMNHEMMMGNHMMMNDMGHGAMMKCHMKMDDMNHGTMMKDHMMMDEMNHEMMGNHMMMNDMKHEMLDIEEQDTMKHCNEMHTVHHICHHADNEHEEMPCGCKNKMKKDINNKCKCIDLKYRIVSIDEILSE